MLISGERKCSSKFKRDVDTHRQHRTQWERGGLGTGTGSFSRRTRASAAGPATFALPCLLPVVNDRPWGLCCQPFTFQH